MIRQTLPSIASMCILPEPQPPRRPSAIPAPPPILPAPRLSTDTTRELATCPNGAVLSQDIVRDGIDALLQLKQSACDFSHVSYPQAAEAQQRPAPDERLRPAPGHGHGRWTSSECADRFESSEDEMMDDASDWKDHDFAASRPTKRYAGQGRHLPTPPMGRRHLVPIHQKQSPPSIAAKPFQGNRPPTIWHHRKSDPQPHPSKQQLSPPILLPSTPQSPASELITSRSQTPASDTAPATLHFSCLQCHRAKKRCNRTRPCSRCVSRGLEHECKYPDKHDPRAVLRACLRCWQTKKKCDRKQPSCGKCDKVGVKCVYRREVNIEPEVYFLHPIFAIIYSGC
jgi:Fungal Zn(2)-Cys(6) binuclear cluster domain